MSVKAILTVIIIIITVAIYGQENNGSWEKINFLVGNWKGEGSGKPGEGEGYFSFKYDLNNKILLRESHSEYPATKDKPLIIHDDLMIIYPDSTGNPGRGIYFDNEGHVINYSITFPNGNAIVFTSDNTPLSPIFRLTYSKIENDFINVKFEISRDGQNYSTYLEGKSKRSNEEE